MKQMKHRPPVEAISLQELAQQQGVGPVADLQEIARLWPVDDNPEELLNFILSERRARRQSRRERKQGVPHGSRRS